MLVAAWQTWLTVANTLLALGAIGFTWYQFSWSRSGRIVVTVDEVQRFSEGNVYVRFLASNAGSASAWAVVLEVLDGAGEVVTLAAVQPPLHPGGEPVVVDLEDVPEHLVVVPWHVRLAWVDANGPQSRVEAMVPVTPQDMQPVFFG